MARWGLVPFFTKDLQGLKGLSTINARAETITKAPTWREPFKKRRCMIPANSFYEWPKEGDPPKQPYAFELANGNLMGFAVACCSRLYLRGRLASGLVRDARPFLIAC